MKDMRTSYDAGRLAELARNAASQEAERRSWLRRRLLAVVLVVAALGVVIGPHLLDANRISSVAAQAARDDGGPAFGAQSCPSAPTLPVRLPSAVPLGLTGVVICRYPGNGSGAPLSSGVVPIAQLAVLNADLREHTFLDRRIAPHPGVEQPEQRLPLWTLLGVTAQGQRVALLGIGAPREYSWETSGPGFVWRPAPEVQRMLAADLSH